MNNLHYFPIYTYGVNSVRLSQAQRQERTRGLLISAAQSLLETNRTDLPISKICEEAGVAVGSFYNYFESKSHLFDRAAIELLLDFHPKLQKIVDRFDDPGQGIIASFRHTAHLATSNPRMARIIVHAGPGAFTDYSEYGKPVIEALRKSVEAGNAKCDDVMGFLVALSGAYQNMLAFSLQDPNYDPQQIDRGIAIFARALGYSEEIVSRICFGPVEQV
ncbi:MAG: TetR/AcrR family transcriptional regulator [Micrococcales bacterium]